MKFTGEELQRFRDSLTEGYNVTPNFFIRNGVPEGEINYSDPSSRPTTSSRKTFRNSSKTVSSTVTPSSSGNTTSISTS